MANGEKGHKGDKYEWNYHESPYSETSGKASEELTLFSSGNKKVFFI